MMKKLICFSLWGDNPKYTVGALKNVELARSIYPDWVCRFYVGDDVSGEVVEKLGDFSNVEVVVRGCEGFDSMFWRFLPISEECVMISRDCDSRLGVREKSAVDAWLDTGKLFHVMRDHRWHGVSILGGMFGCRGGVIKDVDKLIDRFLGSLPSTGYYQIDQQFLARVLWPVVKDDVVVHDEIFDGCVWPTGRVGGEYVGAPFDELDRLLIPFVG